MKCKDDHHTYELDLFEEADEKVNVWFIKKEPRDKEQTGSKEMITLQNGTTNEEVLKMLIHRIRGLNVKFPSTHNEVAILNCENALNALENRTKDREERGVEGKAIA